MNIKNRRGEVITLTVVALVAAIAFLVGMGNPIKSLFGGNGKNRTQTVVKKSESKPIIVKAGDGTPYFLQATTTEESRTDFTEQPKLTLWQRLMVLPKLWLILMVLGIFFPPLSAVMSFINGKLKAEFKKVVGGVEESLKTLEATSPEAKKTVLDTLSKKYDSSTKELVSKIKRKL